MNPEQIELKYCPSTGDLSGDGIRKALRGFWWKIGWCFAAAVYIRTLVFKSSVIPHHYPLGLTLGLTFAVYAVWAGIGIALSIASAVRNGGRDHSVLLAADGIAFVTPESRAFFAWKSIRKISASSGGVMLRTSTGSELSIPARAFHGPQDRDAFVQTASGVRSGYGLPVVQGSSAVWPPPPAS
jgi:hypothetical protein